jgi:hypothetical protein
MTSISEQLNYIPHKAVDTPFEMWFSHYRKHIIEIFAIFKEKLYDVYPFTEKDMDSQEMLKNFAKNLYKSSSGVIK